MPDSAADLAGRPVERRPSLLVARVELGAQGNEHLQGL